MKRDSDDICIVQTDPLSISSYTFYRLLAGSEILYILKGLCNEEFFVKTVSDVFVESFVVVDKYIYNKSIVNSLNKLGLVNELGLCLIRRLVIAQ